MFHILKCLIICNSQCFQGESGATAEERQNNQNAGLEGEESRPESRPLLQETQPGMTKASPPLEDEDRGLGDSLPNTTSSSQTSLSGLPTLMSSNNLHQSPTAFQLPSVDMVRAKWKLISFKFLYFIIYLFQILITIVFVFSLMLQDNPLQHRLVPLQGKVPAAGGRLPPSLHIS